MSCESLRSLWETFLDGELPSRQMLELQSHLDACADCSEALAFSQAIRSTARQVVYDDALVTDDFRQRLSGALLGEAREERETLAQRKSVRFRRRFGRAPEIGIGALAVAASVLAWLRVDGPPDEAKDVASEAERQAVVTLGPQELLDLFLDYHSAPPMPAVTEPRLVPELERDVGVRVPLPALKGAEWLGGNLVRAPRMQPAAYLRYRTQDAHTVTLYVYNASRVPLHASLRRRMFREQPVYERNWRGYQVAAQVEHGVGYAIATDLDEAHSAELVRTITSSIVGH